MPPALPALRVGAFQFDGSADIARNLAAIRRGIRLAAQKRVRLLALPECALSGYAGVHLPSPGTIDKSTLAQAERDLAREAAKRKMFLGLGTTTFTGGHTYNSLRLLAPCGRTRKLYHKRAMYGEDNQHYSIGTGRDASTTSVDGWRVGLRICFEFRFPEYFRELLDARAHLCVMGFCMVGPTAAKLPVARAHLVSRAAENGIYLVAANSTSNAQNAPTCIIAPDGTMLEEAPPTGEALISATLPPVSLAPVPASIVQHARALQKK